MELIKEDMETMEFIKSQMDNVDKNDSHNLLEGELIHGIITLETQLCKARDERLKEKWHYWWEYAFRKWWLRKYKKNHFPKKVSETESYKVWIKGHKEKKYRMRPTMGVTTKDVLSLLEVMKYKDINNSEAYDYVIDKIKTTGKETY